MDNVTNILARKLFTLAAEMFVMTCGLDKNRLLFKRLRFFVFLRRVVKYYLG